ncbi:MAG: restriction endonuclease subunit S [Bacteroidetes bacterium]|nr:restriction endonuclease subunit S [Bacteroidota bacterium]
MKGFKNTEVGLIPEDWEVKPLGEIVDFLDGKRKPIKDSDRSKMKGMYPYYGASGIIDYVNDYIFDEELILLGEDGENILSRNLRLAFNVSGKIWVNNHAHVIRPKKNYNIDYLSEKLESINYEQFNSGTAQPKLNQKTCKIIPIPLPPTLAEQTAIATALNDADALIQKLEQLIAKKRNIKTGAMQELLASASSAHGKPKEGWEVKAIEECSDCLDNLRIPLNESQRLSMKGDYPYCGANGILDYINDYKIDDEVILIAEDGGYFDEYATRPIAYKMKGKFWVNNHAHILKAKPEYEQDFVFYSLVHKNILNFLASGTRAKLNKSEMYKIEIDTPKDKNEQIRIAQILSDMDNEIQELEKQLEKYKRIKQAMMQNLLTGKIRLV